MTRSEHPDAEALGRFALGRLDRKGMAAVEGHLRQCPTCERIALRAPDDRLVALLRAPAAGPAAGPSPAERPSRAPGMVVLLLGLAGVLGLSTPGCSGEPKPATFSAADQAKAKAAYQKRFEDGGGKQMTRKTSP